LSSNWALSVMLQPSSARKDEIAATIPRAETQVTRRQNLVMNVCLADDANHREFPGGQQDEMSRSRYHAPALMTSGQNTLSEKSVEAVYVFETRLNL
jgi:hypothetical protein